MENRQFEPDRSREIWLHGFRDDSIKPSHPLRSTSARALGAAEPTTKSFAARQDRRVPEVSGQRSEVSAETRKNVQKKQHFDG
jgi:hypothetical protein